MARRLIASSSVARVRKFVDAYVKKEGLARNLEEHGRMYCPCADVEASKEKGAEMVCPCTPHHADVARQGYCDCALFASPAFVARERLRKSQSGG